jgi:hypothetical protein
MTQQARDNGSFLRYLGHVEGESPARPWERAAGAAAEGEIARNLSGKRTADALDTLESRGYPAPKV